MSNSINPYESPQVHSPELDVMPSEGLRRKKIVPARKGPRLVNFIVDYIAVYFINIGFAMALVAIWGNEALDFLDSPAGMLTSILAYVVYFVGFEATIGQTLGKLVTGTVVVNRTGEKPTFGQVLGRTFARFIPLEPLSFLGQETRGWHDTMSKTFVVNRKRLAATNPMVVR